MRWTPAAPTSNAGSPSGEPAFGDRPVSDLPHRQRRIESRPWAELPGRAPRSGGDGRRVRLRQIRGRHGGDRPAAGVRRCQRIGQPGRPGAARLVRRGDVADSRAPHRHGVPGPDVGADAGVHRRRPDRRGDPGTQSHCRPGRRPPAGHRTARTGGYQPAPAAGPGIPARTVRRRAAAGRHRHRDLMRPRPDHLRRAHDRPGRDRAGADPRCAPDGP